MSWRARFSPNLSNVFTFINPKDPACYGVRHWWKTNLPELQALNPLCRFDIQELSFGEPFMFAVYTEHDQRMLRLTNTTPEEMDSIMEACVTYGMNHALLPRHAGDDGGNKDQEKLVINFGYAEYRLKILLTESRCKLHIIRVVQHYELQVRIVDRHIR